MAYTLPFVEQGNLYSQIDFNSRVTNKQFASVISTSLPTMFCPSSTNRVGDTFDLKANLSTMPPSINNQAFPIEIARSQYVGCIGSVLTPNEIMDGI